MRAQMAPDKAVPDETQEVVAPKEVMWANSDVQVRAPPPASQASMRRRRSWRVRLSAPRARV
jgi:hypothetical protein